MMTVTKTDTIPAITRHEMQGLATTEYARFVDHLRLLQPEDWSKPTDCSMWDVRAMAGHSLGMMNDFTSFRAFMKEEVGGQTETWRMAYLLDVILTRDPWMHRVDIARATASEMVLTSEHDGRIIADVVAEWARRHGQPFRLTLTGPAGGEFVAGLEGELITIDAVEFCRIISGRADGTGLLTQEVPF